VKKLKMEECTKMVETGISSSTDPYKTKTVLQEDIEDVHNKCHLFFFGMVVRNYLLHV
jgi:hypothetical protein